MEKTQIFRLQPAYKDYLWGGTKLKELYGKQSDLHVVAESWELSTHRNGDNIVASGQFAGQALSWVYRQHRQLFGTKCANKANLPILIKFIDAKQALSIQVHPREEFADKALGEAAKTEMWIVLESEPDAFLYMGLNCTINKQQFEEHIKNNTLLDVLDKVPVHKGDVFFIRAGTVHAIGAGIVIAEVQQNSDTTYRVYDFGRLSADGKPRELHVEKAIEVSDLQPANRETPGKTAPKAQAGGSIECLAACEYFSTQRVELNTEMQLAAVPESFTALMWVGGAGTITSGGESFTAKQGDTFFVPAGEFMYAIKGRGEVLLVRV